MTTVPVPPGPTVLDALALAAEAVDELVVGTARDTHLAVARRIDRTVTRVLGRTAAVPTALHTGIARTVYGGLGLGLRATARGLGRWARTGAGTPLEASAGGRFVRSAVNGLIGDQLVDDHPRLALTMTVRAPGVGDVDVRDAAAVAVAYPAATGRVAVLLHGLCENESYWERARDVVGTTYPAAFAAKGWTPVLLRANTGLGVRANGVALSSLLQDLVDHWPVPVERITLVGHSMGGLVMRAAGAVATDAADPWTQRVSDVVTLGTPHLGAPIARGIGHGSTGLGWLPETAPFGRFLDRRSAGVRDLVAGLTADVAPLPSARYRLVSATVTRSPRHPVGWLAGDLLVRERSAYGVEPGGRTLFPGAERLHLGHAHHFHLLNDPRLHAAFDRWLD